MTANERRIKRETQKECCKTMDALMPNRWAHYIEWARSDRTDINARRFLRAFGIPVKAKVKK